jgi:hypothetical protein
VISIRFKSGSTPAILLSVTRLVFWAIVAATRLTLRALKKSVVLWIGFWIGYAAVTRDRPRA